MESQQNDLSAGSSHRDTALLVTSLGLIVAGLAAFYLFAAELVAPVRVLILGVAYQTALGKTLWGYIAGSRIELRKIVWPSRQESVQATLMIAVVVLLMALLLWGLDSVLLWAVKLLTGRGD
jgi:preprotein translocase subunit SecE